MISHKKLLVLSILFIAKLHSIYQIEPTSHCVQLADCGKLLCTFNNAQKSLLLRSLADGTASSISLPSMDAHDEHGRKSFGTAMKMNRLRNRIALGYKYSSNVDIVDLATQQVESLKKDPVACEHGHMVTQVAGISWSDDNNLLAMYPQQAEAHGWVMDRRTGRVCFIGKDHAFIAVIDPQGKHLLQSVRGDDPTGDRLSSYDISSGVRTDLFKNDYEGSKVSSIIFSHDGSLMGVNTEYDFCLRNGTTYEKIENSNITHFERHSTQTFNNEGTLLANSFDNFIDIISVPDMNFLAMLHSPEKNVIQFDWDGDTLAAACSERQGCSSIASIMTWDMAKELQK